MAKKGIGGVISGAIILFLGAVIITAGVAARPAINTLLIESMIDDAFVGIEDQAIPELAPGIDVMGYPMFLDGLMGELPNAFGGLENTAFFINGSTSAAVMYMTADALHPSPPGPYADLNAALVGLFNDNIQTNFGTPIPGISEAMNGGAPIGYTLPMVGALCMGTGAPPFVGILEEDPLGDMTPGILVFLQTYQAALADPPTMAAMLAAYGLPAQPMLDAVAGYIMGVLFPAVPAIIGQQLEWAVPACTADTVDDYILAQWAEKVLFPGGLGTISPAATGFEIGADFTSLAQVQGLWVSMLVDFPRWYGGDPTLQAELSLNATQYAAVNAWIPAVKPTVLAGIADYFGIGNDDHYVRLFATQWLNMTLGALDPRLADGFLEFVSGSMNLTDAQAAVLEGAVFELNMTEEVIDYNTAYLLWEDFKTEEGILEWYEAVDKRGKTTYLGLQTEFGLNDTQMEFVCDYLDNFRTETIFAMNALQEEEDQISLPIWGLDVEKALNDLELYLPIAGGVFACAGVLMIALFARKRS